MCTAATYKTKDFYFGRSEEHYAIIGMAHVADGYPMFYDAVNEKGLAMAGLNFVGNAVYREPIAETETGVAHNRAADRFSGRGKEYHRAAADAQPARARTPAAAVRSSTPSREYRMQ